MTAVQKSEQPAHSVSIYLAGDLAMVKHYCLEFCRRGLCVTVTPVDFIYAGGAEAGVRIGLVNYPRFPALPHVIDETAEDLARFLIERMHQDTALIDAPDRTIWLTRRAGTLNNECEGMCGV